MSDTLTALLDAAEDAMRLRGYHAVSFRDLADELGIKSSSVHYYFRQKEDLGIAVVTRYVERFFAALECEVEGAKSVEAKVQAFFRVYRHVLTSSDKICLCGMLGAESFGLPPDLAKVVAEFFKSNVEWLVDVLDDVLQKAEAQRRAEHIATTLQGAMMVSSSLRDHKVFDRAVRDMSATLGLSK